MPQIIPTDNTPLHRTFLRILLLAFSYYLFAKLGLIFAIPPGYASAIWPPSGPVSYTHLTLPTTPYV